MTNQTKLIAITHESPSKSPVISGIHEWLRLNNSQQNAYSFIPENAWYDSIYADNIDSTDRTDRAKNKDIPADTGKMYIIVETYKNGVS